MLFLMPRERYALNLANRFLFSEQYLQPTQWQAGIILILRANPHRSKQTMEPATSASGISADIYLAGSRRNGGRERGKGGAAPAFRWNYNNSFMAGH